MYDEESCSTLLIALTIERSNCVLCFSVGVASVLVLLLLFVLLLLCGWCSRWFSSLVFLRCCRCCSCCVVLGVPGCFAWRCIFVLPLRFLQDSNVWSDYQDADPIASQHGSQAFEYFTDSVVINRRRRRDN